MKVPSNVIKTLPFNGYPVMYKRLIMLNNETYIMFVGEYGSLMRFN
jgi:hypothetical protein